MTRYTAVFSERILFIFTNISFHVKFSGKTILARELQSYSVPRKKFRRLDVLIIARQWIFGSVYCSINSFTSSLTVSVSVFTLLALTIERYKVDLHIIKDFLLSCLVAKLQSVMI